MRKCHLMDGLRIQLQHKEGIVAPLREEGGGGGKGNVRACSRLAGAVIAPELPAGINKANGRALSSESSQELNSQPVLAAHILSPLILLPTAPRPCQHGVNISYSAGAVGEVTRLGQQPAPKPNLREQ